MEKMEVEKSTIHPLLQNVSIFTWHLIIDTEEKALKFLSEMGLIPYRAPGPSCPLCKGRTLPFSYPNLKLRWKWLCESKRTKKCFGSINPAKNTFLFMGKLPPMDILGIIFGFILEIPVMKHCNSVNAWRRHRGMKILSAQSMSGMYQFCQEVMEIVSSHYIKELAAPEKEICLDESVFVNRKYSEEGMTAISAFCVKSKEGLILQIDKKIPRKKWTKAVEHHCKSEITVTCIKKKLSKKGTVNSNSGEMKQQQTMIKNFYRRVRMVGPSEGEMFQQFLEDIGRIYPGPGVEGLKMLRLGATTTDAEVLAQSVPQERPWKQSVPDIVLQLQSDSQPSMPPATVSSTPAVKPASESQPSLPPAAVYVAPSPTPKPVLQSHYPVPPAAVSIAPSPAFKPVSQSQSYVPPGTVLHTVRLNRNFNRVLSVTTVAAANQLQPQNTLAPAACVGKTQPKVKLKSNDHKYSEVSKNEDMKQKLPQVQSSSTPGKHGRLEEEFEGSKLNGDKTATDDVEQSINENIDSPPSEKRPRLVESPLDVADSKPSGDVPDIDNVAFVTDVYAEEEIA